MHFNTHIFLSYPKYFILYILKLYSQVVLVIKRKTLQVLLINYLQGLVVPRAGIEPARVLPHRFLRPTRLPIPPPRH